MTRVLTLLLGLSCGLASAQTIITTLAGSRFVFPSGTMPAIDAPVGDVSGVTEDQQGNIYFSDITTDRVFRVDIKGNLTAFAGSGTQGYGGDGGPAASAALFNPRGLAFDSSGNLYICDTGNYRIRQVTPAGVISTVAGNGTDRFSGDGGPAASASFGSNTRIAVDATGNIYISDPDNHRIRRITNGVIHTFAGNGNNASTGDGGSALQASLMSPLGLTFDPTGNLYIADSVANRVRMITPSGAISTVAGTGGGAEAGDGGLAIQAKLNGPTGVAIEGSIQSTPGNLALLVADQNGSRLRSINLTSGIITTVAGTLQQVGMAGDGGPAVNASLYGPVDLFVAQSASGPVILIADLGNFRLRRIVSGTISTVAGNGNYGYTGDGGIGTDATLPGPDGVVIDSSGNAIVCDSFANRVRSITTFGIINLIAGDNTPGFTGDGGPAVSASLVDCQGIAIDGAGNLYIADTHDRRIRKVSTTGVITTVAGTGMNSFSGDGGQAVNAALSQPEGIAVDSQGNLYIADTGNNRIRRVTPSGIITTIAGSGTQGYAGDGASALGAQLNAPTRIALDPSGNIYFTDNGNNVVRRILVGGTIQPVAGNGQYGFSGDGGQATSAMLANPIGLAIDASGGVLIADANNARIRRVDPTGIINTIAGNGTNTLAGDGRPPLQTGFGSPADVTVDPEGNIYIADQNDGRIRRIETKPPSLVVSDSGLTFMTAIDGIPASSRTVTVLNGGSGTIGYSAVASMLSGNAGWLSVSPSQGATSASAGSAIVVSVNTGGLAAGDYYGRVEIASPGVANSPRFITVVLHIIPPSQTTGPNVSPASFLFSAAAGAMNPPAQTLTLSILHAGAVSYTSTIGYGSSSQFLTVTPASGSFTGAAPANLTIQPNIAGLATGIYTATINLSFASGALRAIPVTLTVYSASSANRTPAIRTSRLGEHPSATICTPTQLLPAITGLGQSFSVPAGWPAAIDVNVLDDCGNTFTSGSVAATFSNGDAPLALGNLQNGVWAATWAPRSVANVTIKVTARSSPPGTLQGFAQILGQVSPNTEPPIVNTGGILNSASFAAGEPSTPGALISIFGSNLASGNGVSATSLPLPTQLAGTQVIIGGMLMPLLYAGPTQINAVVPFPVPVNATQQVIVQSGNTLSVPEPTNVALDAPAAFTLNGSGTGAAIVAAANSDGAGYIVTTSQPAHPGSVIVVYCTGLGGVQSSLQAGDATPLSPLATTTDTVTLTIGGANAQVLFAGLTPTLSGLYQINAVIPAGVTGDAVPLVITGSASPGPPATIPIH
ncbi:MAG TPA: hypothetical protein VHY84_16460 [Bryobacteraceae bacterium]|jgi:uncharacterized protein (TIGR03437 family)|nr:hypothetical protein [Bryobacteraceae bacterium]